MWVQAMYRATGQAHKPVPPKQGSSLPRSQDSDKAKKHGMDEFIQADPVKFPHDQLFCKVQSLTLDYRLTEIICSLVCVIFMYVDNIKTNFLPFSCTS
uniref:Uncharacterized protein n=1 Tax=Romanomermis culicivorax TaxID=13658 RepID=A0A915JIC5_ROMCU